MKKRAKRELSFRRAMTVTEVLVFSRGGYTFPRCPRCRLSLDREYVRFCDRCGQKLDWTSFDRASTIRLS